MIKRTKIWLVTAASLVLIGSIVFGGVMAVLKWDFTKLSTTKYVTNEHKINEDCKNISIITDTADVTFSPSENTETLVVCREQENCKHSVTLKDDTLTIELRDTRKWYEHIGINFGTPKITVYIPQGEYGKLSAKTSTGNVEIPEVFKFRSIDISVSTGDVKNYASALEDVKIKTTTGNIRIEDASAGALDLTVSTGKVTVSGVTCEDNVTVGVSTGKTYLSDIQCKNVISDGSTGDISLNNIFAAEKFFVERSTGDVKFNSCDSAEIYVKTDTGNVSGTLLSDKVFITETDTGSISVPNSITGGRCEIITDTGDIKIDVIP